MKITPEFLDLLSEYAKILIPSIITYIVTRYSLLRPKKYEIKNKQFNLVYLPLYLLTIQYLSTKEGIKNIDVYFRKVDKIIYKNYQYVFPKTITLFNTLKSSWQKKNRNYYHLTAFQSQISSDYEKLKRELGYPSNSVIDYFRRLSSLDKAFYIIYGLVLLLAIIFGFNLYTSIVQNRWIDSIISCISLLILIFFIYIIRYPSKH